MAEFGAANSSPRSAIRWHPATILIVLVILTLAFISPLALWSVLVGGLSASVVLAPAIGLGLGLASLFGFQLLSWRWFLLVATALGLGMTSLLVLGLGLAGLLHRPLWIFILFLFSGVGIWSIVYRSRHREGASVDSHSPNTPKPRARSRPMPLNQVEKSVSKFWNSSDSRSWERALLWGLGPFLVLGLLAASAAPGYVWSEEGFAYDVLEYHLQLPREYFEAGRIAYAPHNVYANFPANVEMLYLLAMIVQGNPLDAAVTAHCIHLAFALLTVWAAWIIGSDWSPGSGAIAAWSTASCGWLVYFCGLAYVENGMLFFGLVSLGAVLRGGTAGTSGMAWNSLGGICAGLACGCKYTAVPMIAVPFAIAAGHWPMGLISRRLARLGGFGLGCAVALAPWLGKNLIMTGNPVFPLLNRMIQASPPGWGPEQTEQWEQGHQLPKDQRSFQARLSAAWRHTLGDRDQRWGPLLIVLAGGSLLVRASRYWTWEDAVLLLILVFQAVVWFWATHLYARFAVPFLVPLCLMAGRAALAAGESRTRSTILISMLGLGMIWNFAFAARLQVQELTPGAPAAWFYNGELHGFEYLKTVNQDLPQEAQILMVGDAKAFYVCRRVDACVVFNRNPFVDVVRSAHSDSEIVDWFRSKGYTHVLVHWSEVRRLAETYGFPREISPELFERLERAGLSVVQRFKHPGRGGSYVDLYAVNPLP